jgi:hypothetical protein
MRDSKVRCPRSALNMSETPSYLPGDMNSMFEGNHMHLKCLGVSLSIFPYIKELLLCQ